MAKTKKPKRKRKTFIVECEETEARSTTYRVEAASAEAARALVANHSIRSRNGGKNFTRIEDGYNDTLTCDVVGIREEK